MSGLEVGLALILLLFIGGFIAIFVALSRTLALQHDTEAKLRENESLLQQEHENSRKERSKRKDIQRQAAKAFVRAKELEADLEALKRTMSQQHLGLMYNDLPHNKGIASIMRSLQNVMHQFQGAACNASRKAFLKQTDFVIKELEKNENPVKCDDVDKSVSNYLADVEKELAEQLPGVNNDEIVSDLKQVWKQVSRQVCNHQGYVDVDMLGAFMDAVFESICGIPPLMV
jgi:hypothetical protein